MVVAALILSVLALIASLASLVLLIAQRMSTHKLEIIDPKAMAEQVLEMEKQDAKINDKVRNIETQSDDWL